MYLCLSVERSAVLKKSSVKYVNCFLSNHLYVDKLQLIFAKVNA